MSGPLQANTAEEGGAIHFDRRIADVQQRIAAEYRVFQSAERQAEDLLAGRQPSNKNLVFPWPEMAERLDGIVQTFGEIAQISDFDETAFATDLEDSKVCGVQVAAIKRLRLQSRALKLAQSRAEQYRDGLDRQQKQLTEMMKIVTGLLDHRAVLAVNQFSRYVFVGDWAAVEVTILPSLLELQRLSGEVRSRIEAQRMAFAAYLDRIDDVIEETREQRCAIAGRWIGDCEDSFARPTPAMRLSLSLSDSRKIGNLQVGDKSWPASAIRFVDRSELRFRVQSGVKSYRFDGMFSADFRSIKGHMGDRTEPKFWTCDFIAE